MEDCIIKRSPGLGRKVMKLKRRRGAPRKGLKRSQRRQGGAEGRGLGSGGSSLLCSRGSG